MTQLKSIKGICKACSNKAVTFDGYCEHHMKYRDLKNYHVYPVPTKSQTGELFGIEIELKGNYRVIANLSKYVCYDGSVDNGGEIKILGNFNSAVRKTLDVLKRANIAGCYTDRSCGFHVHVTKGEVFVQKCMRIQDNLRNIFAGRNFDWCKRINNMYDLYSHYSWVNLPEKVPTIEFRIFPATMDKRVATSYIRMSKVLKDYITGHTTDSQIDTYLNKYAKFYAKRK